MRFERRVERTAWLALAAPLAAVIGAMVLSAGLIRLAGVPALSAFGEILSNAFGSRLAITETLTRATPLMLTGLAAVVAFRARIWNIGAEGQLYIGALAVAALGTTLSGWPGAIAIPTLMLGGALAGALLLLIPLLLRLRFGVDEVVTTLLLNFVAVLFVSLMIEGPLKDPMAFGWPQSVPVPIEAELPKLVERTRLHIGLLIAIVLALIVHVVQSRTLFGLRSRAVGLNADGARFAGVRIGRTLILTGCLSGALAGLAGAIEVMGVKGYVTTDLSPGYGYSGILVAMLAALHPLGVVAASLFAATLFVGADGMSRAVGVPTYIADVTVALSLLTMLVALFFTQYRVRR